MDGSSVFTFLAGGNPTSFYQPVAFDYLVTSLAAGAHTFDLYASVFGGDPGCLSLAATIVATELKR